VKGARNFGISPELALWLKRAATSGDLAAHEAAANPHPVYLTQAEADALYDPLGGGGAVSSDALWDAKGDLAVGTGANAAARLAAGTNGYVLSADSAEATGLKWIAAPTGGDVATDTLWDAKGDLVVGTGANAAARLPAGTNGYVLSADSAEATGLKWIVAPSGSGTGNSYFPGGW
jgi:hypothetical protein